MNVIKIFSMAMLGGVGLCALTQRDVATLNDGWKFSKGAPEEAKEWQTVRVPHDWAIYGPFSRDNDLQIVAVEQNGETEKTVKTGRTGGLPFIVRAPTVQFSRCPTLRAVRSRWCLTVP